MLGIPGISVNGATFGHARRDGRPTHDGRRDYPPTVENDDTISDVAHGPRVARRE